MGFGFDFENILSKAAETVDTASKGAADAAGAVAQTVSSAATAAGKAAIDTTKAASKVAGSLTGTIAEGACSAGRAIAASDIGKAASGATDIIGGIAVGAATEAMRQANNVVSDAASAMEDGVNFLKDNSFSARLKRARLESFKHGMKQGIYLAGQRRFDFYYAYLAILCFFLRCDGEFSKEEQDWLGNSLESMSFGESLPTSVKARMREIASNETLTFDDVKEHLDKVSLVSLDAIKEHIQIAVELDGEVTEEEQRADRLFSDYVAARAVCISLDDNWADKVVEKSVREYGENIERINREFREKTKLQDEDTAFVIGATMLQVVRVLAINALTQIEDAGQCNTKEQVLHDVQNDLFQKFNDSGAPGSTPLYASKHHILTARGVPYDATRYAGESLKLFQGANHRFATLGHDPVLGLLFGTANIMTNSITCVKSTGTLGIGLRIPMTFSVAYDFTGKNPQIAEPVSTIRMLINSGKRVVEEPSAAAAALIKQIVHIGTDLYTPCGIQLPFANLALDKAHVEKLTEYVSTGDVLKVGAQAGMAVLINWLIAALHGCSLIFKDDASDYAFDLHQTRTKKIILISNTLATSSSVIQAAITKNPKCLDLGGAAVLVYRLFTDLSFIARLKEEYVNSKLDEIYDTRERELLG
ncbi:MAG: hypothetical protein HFJ68_05565 [Adlercreutzia caecimuris]|jgi:hypothetical protein|uniref:hypothetical protein n=1 Tax=Adlercreutzia caecimuris TaxID=671266 RepID=UPI000EE170F2|nr:hypothetical protein [Adlercreutzia caecimuris]MCI9208005.1 hypothetical protein [Adlercreutzia caecimuris]